MTITTPPPRARPRVQPRTRSAPAEAPARTPAASRASASERTRSRSSASQRAYARKAQRQAVDAGGGSSGARRTPFVLLVMALLAIGLITSLWLSTAASADSYRLEQARLQARELAERSAQLRQEVANLQTAPELARRARELGMVPTDEPATLLVQPDGSVVVVGKPAAATAPPPPVPPAPPPGVEQPAAAPADAQPAGPEQAAVPDPAAPPAAGAPPPAGGG